MSRTPQLFPKPPKRMKEPTKDHFRWRAELAEAQRDYARTPTWWRIWNRLRWRIIEKDKAA